MTHVLLVAYYFPPLGGGGSQRSLKLARYLPESGCHVTVLAGPGESVDRWGPRDETLLAELPAGAEIHRVAGPEPVPDSWEDRAERWVGRTSTWSRWWIDGAVETGLAIGADADVIVASMSPYVSARAAARLSRELARPWVADLRDPWALDEMMIYPSSVHRSVELRVMRRLLGTSAGIVTTTPEAAMRIDARFPELAAKRVVSIPNGYDAADFAGAPPARDDGSFRIVHTGYFHTDLGRRQRRSGLTRRVVGGTMRGTDILTRSHVYLLEALELLVAREPSLQSTIELHLAGVLSQGDLQEAGRSPMVRHHGYLTHAEAIDLMRSADLLFLPMQNMPSGVRSGIVPGKTYEYLAAERPILAAVPAGDARDILLEAGNARICAPDDVDGMAAVLEAELERWTSDGWVSAEVPPALLQRFERRTLAGQYARLLESVVR